MILYYSNASPYSRKVLLLAWSLGFKAQLTVKYVHPLNDPQDLNDVNPVGKVPALTIGEHTVSDSPLIAEHLLWMADHDRASEDYISVLRTQSFADSMTDSAVARTMEGFRPPEQQSPLWMARYEAAIMRSLDVMEAFVPKLTGWGLDTMAVACALDYLDFRHSDIVFQDSHPACAEFWRDACARPDMQETNPRNA